MPERTIFHSHINDHALTRSYLYIATILESMLPALIVPQNPAPIPTLGQWRLIILGLVISIFGISFLKKSFNRATLHNNYIKS